MGLDPHIEMWNRPPRWGGRERADVVAFVRNRLCLRADRDEETAMRRSTVFSAPGRYSAPRACDDVVARPAY
jgi:hypothetical protein